jgi:DnaJ-class molecular chaperone
VANLGHHVVVGIAEAALGTTVAVPLIDGGDEEIVLAAGTQPGTVIRMAGKGMTRLGRRGRGDLLVEVVVRVPTDLTSEQADALRAYADLVEESPSETRKRRFF